MNNTSMISGPAPLVWHTLVNLVLHAAICIAGGICAAVLCLVIDQMMGRQTTGDEMWGTHQGFVWAALVFRPVHNWFGRKRA